MKTKIISILIVMTILILGLNYGLPIEITFQPAHRIGVLILTVVVGIIFFLLFRQSLKFKKHELKLTGIVLMGIILLPYLWIGLGIVIPALISDDYPMLEDISEYTNQDGERIVGQFIEISGSLHHYQNRKVLYDFENGIRISYLYPDEKINGAWTYHRYGFDFGHFSKSDTIYIAEFEKGQIKK